MTDQVYDSAAEVEAARADGEEIDYATQVKGDDGLTDDERRLAKIERGRDAEERSDAERERIEKRDGLAPGSLGRTVSRETDDEGGASSPGSSSESSSDETSKSVGGTKPARRSTARTTEPPS